MKKPLIVCASPMEHLPVVRQILEKDCDVRYIQATPEELAKNIVDADAYFAGLAARLTKEMIDGAKNLKLVVTPSTGLDHLDLAALEAKKIPMVCLKYEREFLDSITATAELAWTLMLCCARRIPEALQASRNGEWARDKVRGHQMAYKTLGIIGCGRLGTIMTQYGRGFRMKVLGNDVKKDIKIDGVEMVSLDRLLNESDVISIHIHLTPENERFINKEKFSKMKPGVTIINTSRGKIIDEDDLIEAMDKGIVGAAGLDVIDGEWLDNLYDHKLIAYSRTHGNLVITPHVGGITQESQEMASAFMARKLVNTLKDLIKNT